MYLEITNLLQFFAFAEQDAGPRGKFVAVREAECDVIPMAIQITKVSAQAVKGDSPFDRAGGERRQNLLQKKMRRHQKLADFGWVGFFDVF